MKLLKGMLLVSSLFALNACGTLLKNSEATKKAAEKTSGVKYEQSMEDIKSKVTVMVMNAQIGMSQGKAPNMEGTPPVKGSLKYDGKVSYYKDMQEYGRDHLLLKNAKNNIVMLGKRGGKYLVFDIKDAGKYRTVAVKTFDDLVVTRTSKGPIDVSIMGVGVNYKDYNDIDESMKKAYVDEMEQWQLLQALNPTKADALYKEAEASVKDGDYVRRVK